MNEQTINQEELREFAGHLTQNQYASGEFFEFADSLCETDRARLYSQIREIAKNRGWASRSAFDEFVKAHNRDLKQQAVQRKQAARQEKQKQDGLLLDPVGKESLKEGFAGIDEIIGEKPNYGKYSCSDKGVYYIAGTGEEIAVKVCSHPLFPSKRYINIESGKELLDISYKIDSEWRTAKLIDRKTISQARLIPALSEFGMDVTSENAKDVVKYLTEVDYLNREIIPKVETISRLGWIDGRGFSPYIDGVMYDHGSRFTDAFSAVHEKGSFEKWKEVAAEIMTNKSYIPARLVLASSIASVLLRWTCNQPFFVHIWSPESGSGKTVSLMLAASVWADPETGRFVRSLNSTPVAFEQLDSFCNHLPLIQDELQAAKPQDIPKIIYMHGEGTGKARGAKDGGLREQTRWLNIAITSGEQPLTFTDRAGAINRVISIDPVGQIMPGDKQHMGIIADTLRDNYGFAGKYVVDRLLREKGFSEIIQKSYRRLSNEIVKEVTGKQANYAATILIGDQLISSILFGANSSMQYALTPKDIIPFLATSEMVDINMKIKTWLCGFVASNTAYFIKADSLSMDEVRSKVYGKKAYDGSVLFIYQTFKEEMENRGYALTSFMRWCNEREYIKTNYTDTSRHWYVETTFDPVGHVQVIHFLPAMFIDEPKQTEIGCLVNIDHPF